jgi:3-hydroxybutyryl-CoA dehydratase
MSMRPSDMFKSYLEKTSELRILEIAQQTLFFGDEISSVDSLKQHLAVISDPAAYHLWHNKISGKDSNRWEACSGSLSKKRFHLGRNFDAVTYSGDGISSELAESLFGCLKPEGHIGFQLERNLDNSITGKLKSLCSLWLEEGTFLWAQKKSVRELIAFQDIESLQIGQEFRFQHSFSQNDLECFTELSGDLNPLHFDDAYAKRLGFQERLVFGLLSASLISRLVGVYIPGLFSLIREVNISFPRPVYREELLEVTGRVEHIDVPKRLLGIKFDGRRGIGGEKVFRGSVQVSVPSLQEKWK